MANPLHTTKILSSQCNAHIPICICLCDSCRNVIKMNFFTVNVSDFVDWTQYNFWTFHRGHNEPMIFYTIGISECETWCLMKWLIYHVPRL